MSHSSRGRSFLILFAMIVPAVPPPSINNRLVQKLPNRDTCNIALIDGFVFKELDENEKRDISRIKKDSFIIAGDTSLEKIHRLTGTEIKTDKNKKMLIEIKPSRQITRPKPPKKKTKSYMRESFEFIKNIDSFLR